MILIVGTLVGLYHLRLALKTMFVFVNDTTVFQWLFILCGPLLTLPIVLMAFRSMKISGFILIFSAVVSSIFYTLLFPNDLMFINFYIVLGKYCGLSFLLGMIMISVGQKNEK